MALNFPSSPSEGQKFSGFVFTGGLWKASTAPRTALPFNYFVNPSMQWSMENADFSSTVNGRYGADQWSSSYSAPAVITTQRVQVKTPNGSKDRYRMTVTTIDASLAAGDRFYFFQIIEGSRVADLKLGTAQAVQMILRFGFKGPAGTYTATIRNAVGDRSYPSNFTISAGQANTDTEQIIVIPGDTTGTWARDATAGLYFFLTMAAGTSYHGANNTWSAGNFIATAGTSNGVATASAVYEVFDFGLYADPYLTGKPPPWEAVSDARARMDSMRYFYKPGYTQGYASSGTTCGRTGHVHPVTQRVAPTYALPAGTFSAGAITSGAVTAGAVNAYSNAYGWEFNGNIFATPTAPTTFHALAALVATPLSARM